MEIYLFLQALLNGLLLGGLFIVLTIGLNLITGVLKIINFGHGDLIMLAMYITYWLYVYTAYSPLVMMPTTAIIMGFVGLIIYMLLIKPILRASDIEQLLGTLGLGVFLQGLAQVLWKSDYRLAKIYAGSIVIGNIYISIIQLIVFVISLVASILLYIYLMRTVKGVIIRATAQDPDMSSLLGVNIRNVHLIVFFLSFLFIGLTGALLLSMFPAYPTTGIEYGILAWLIMVIGGLGSVLGSFIGGILIGVVYSIFATYYSVELARALIFVAFILTIALRPTGLLGASARV